MITLTQLFDECDQILFEGQQRKTHVPAANNGRWIREELGGAVVNAGFSPSEAIAIVAERIRIWESMK